MFVLLLLVLRSLNFRRLSQINMVTTAMVMTMLNRLVIELVGCSLVGHTVQLHPNTVLPT